MYVYIFMYVHLNAHTLRMHLCMYIFMYVRMYECMYICITYVYMYMYGLMCVYVYVWMNEWMQTCIHGCRMYAWICVEVYICTYNVYAYFMYVFVYLFIMHVGLYINVSYKFVPIYVLMYVCLFEDMFTFQKEKLREELIAYFLLIRHGPHRKRRSRQFFVAAGTSLPSCYLAIIGGYTNRPTDTRVQQLFYCSLYYLHYRQTNA
jgi:hypothetical protein